MSQFAQAPRHLAQIDFCTVKSQTNRFRAALARRRFGLARAIVLYNDDQI